MFNHRNPVIFIILVVFMALMKWKGAETEDNETCWKRPTETIYLGSTEVGLKNEAITEKPLKGGLSRTR